MYRLACLSALPLILSACLFHPYQVPIEQGKALTHANIKAIQPGLSKAQVSYMLGSANMIDPFKPNTWYYIYTSQQDNLPRTEQYLSITFKNDKVIGIAGNYPPPGQVIYNTYQPVK